MTTLDAITARDWSMQLDPPSVPGASLGEVVQTVDDVAQCIGIILTTPPGTDPLRPTFACDVLSFLDLPLTRFRARAVREVSLALARWEPRVAVLGVTVDRTGKEAAGHTQLTIAWRLNVSGSSGAVTRTTIVPLGLVQ